MGQRLEVSSHRLAAIWRVGGFGDYHRKEELVVADKAARKAEDDAVLQVLPPSKRHQANAHVYGMQACM